MLARLGPYVIVFVVALALFSPWILHRDQVLYSDNSDILAEHLPAKRFLVRSFRETGEIPLWCPYNYGGMPFVHDPQVAIFYPPHWLFLALPESSVGMVLSWQIFFHVLVAGWGIVAYARSRGLATGGAITAGIGYMLAGKWLLHLLGGGHYITIGLAWLPWMMLLLERAIRRRSFFSASGAGVLFALMILSTQPQWTLYAGVLTALWTLACALEEAAYLDGEGERTRKRTLTALCFWAGSGAWTVILGVLLSAVQLLPTMEAKGESSRAGGVGTDMILSAASYTLYNLFGPILNAKPPNANWAWEERGGMDALWLAAAAMAPFLGGRRRKYEAGVLLFLVVFGLGGSVAFQWLPGFSYFRHPSRMFTLVALPVAFLAGTTTDALFAKPGPSAETRRTCRFILVLTAAVAIVLSGSFAWTLHRQGQGIYLHPYWITVLCTFVLGFLLIGGEGSGWKETLWIIALGANAWALARPLVQVRPEREIYPVSTCLAGLEILKAPGRVLDRDAGETTGTPLGPGAPMAMRLGIEPIRGYTPLDVRRFKEYLQFIGDSDEPMQTFVSHLTYPVIRNFPIKNKALADLLGIEFLIQPSDASLEQSGWVKVKTDPRPIAYDFVDGGMRRLPPYTVYRNRTVLPRAFVVFEAEALPPRQQVLEALKNTDLRKTVLLDPKPASSPTGSTGKATIETYEPNRVVVNVETDGLGYLVLTDQWFPGWVCKVGDEAAPLHRADYLFRAVAVPGGKCRIEFRFQPKSYMWGRTISLAGLGLVGVIGVVWLCSLLPRAKRKQENGAGPGSF